MKYLTAEKLKDGWLITITTTGSVNSFMSVKDIIKREGLKIRTKFYKKDKNGNETNKIIKIFAD